MVLKHAGDEAAPKPFKTLAEHIFHELRGDLIRGRMEPGSKLRVEELRIKYGVSGSAVREALSRLAALGLVQAEGQRGFFVPDSSVADLLDLTKVRIWVEATALRAAMTSGDSNWEAEILAAAHRLAANEPKVDSADAMNLDPAWEVRHRAYHTALVVACGSPRLLAYREVLYDMSERYRWRSISTGLMGRDVHAEHRRITEAVMARDVPRACGALAGHLVETARMVLTISTGSSSEAAKLVDALTDDVARGTWTPVSLSQI
jgi:GntR family carbon starvation induced transcriptional regulator